jgi:hypothetical protein
MVRAMDPIGAPGGRVRPRFSGLETLARFLVHRYEPVATRVQLSRL